MEKEAELLQRRSMLSAAKKALLQKRLLGSTEREITSTAIPSRTPQSKTILSFAQQRLWFLDQLAPENPFYNIPLLVQLEGPLNVPILHRCLQELVQRHETLRTNFVVSGDEPIQLIAPHRHVALPVIHLVSNTENDRAWAEGASLAPNTENDRAKVGVRGGGAWVEGALAYPAGHKGLSPTYPAGRKGLSPTEQLEHLSHEDAMRPFDLAHEVLMRCTLFRLAPQQHVLLITLHHISADGWSLGILNRELAALYEAFTQGHASPLPPLPIQYADYALWQREWLQGEVLQKDLTYWRQQLADLAPLELPLDYVRPPVQTFHGAVLPFSLTESLSQAVSDFCKREGITLFIALLTAFQMLLARYSGSEDIAVGTPISGRARAELEGLVGFFVNTLVIRTNFADSPNPQIALHRVKDTVRHAFQHQDIPFEKLVEDLQPERNLSQSPLIQTLFTLKVPTTSTQKISQLTLHASEMENESSQFDLMLTMMEDKQQITGQFQYNTDLFAASTIQHLCRHFISLLEAIIDRPQLPLWEIPLLTREESQKVLVTWNSTLTPYPVDDNLPLLFERQVEHTPDAIALAYEDAQIGYGELNRRANQLAHTLHSMGVGPETLAGVYMERSIEMVVALLGILKAGGAYVPLDPEYPSERLAYMLADTAVPIVLTQQHLAPKLPAEGIQHILCLDTGSAPFEAETHGVGAALHVRPLPNTSPTFPDTSPAGETGAREVPPLPQVHITGNNLAYVIYTSGSTGKPKGAMNTHRGICNRLRWMQDAYGLTSTDRVLQKTPYSFDVSVWEFFWPLLTGARLIMARPGGHRDTGYLLKTIIEQQITTLHFVPSLLGVFLDEPGLGTQFNAPNSTLSRVPSTVGTQFIASGLTGTSLQRVICSGEALTSNHQRRFFALLDANLYNLYGPTEAAVDVTAWTCQRSNTQTSVPIGRPIANTHIYVLGHAMQPVPVGVPGELYIGGVNLARGYLKRGDLTAEKFVPHPFSTEPGERLYRTGDRVRYLPDGSIDYLGRIDFQVKLRGQRIELAEIEATLRDCRGAIYKPGSIDKPVVRECVVLLHDKQLVAYVEYVGETTDITAVLRPYLQASLPSYMIPSQFIAIDALPLTSHGKVDRRALAKIAIQPQEAGQVAPPRTPLESQLVELWSEILQRASVGIHDNFFDLGGHSLLATQMISRVRTILGVELALKSLFEAPTIAGIAAQIAQSLQSKQAITIPIVPVQRTQQLPLSFAQQRLWFLDQLEPDMPTYNIPAIFSLHGPLDVQAFNRSLEEVITRHETLRTTFAMQNDQPVQVLASEGRYGWTVIDLSMLSMAIRKIEALQLMHQEAVQPFNLAQGPLLRCKVVRLDAQDHMVALTMHHIISDGWSTSILVRELVTAYTAFHTNEPLRLPELPIGYVDYAAWQRQWLQGETLSKQLDYWRKHLEHVPRIGLSTDYPRPATPTFRGARQAIDISKEVSDGLIALSHREGVTLFMTLLAAFQVLLMRSSGQHDITIGTSVANRRHKELEELIGFFVNVLVMRTDLAGNPSFIALLRRVREAALGAYEHQDIPFEQLVAELQPERDASRSPFFQVTLVLQNTPRSTETLPDLVMEILEPELTTAKFDLSLTVTETEDGLKCTIDYSTDLFAPETIARFLLHWQTLLAGIPLNPEQRISELPLLPDTERQQLLVLWNATQREIPQMTIPALFEQQVERTPDAIVLVDEQMSMTYSELNRRANQLAWCLRTQGVGAESLVGVYIERSTMLIICFLAILKAGGGYVPLDPSYPPARLATLLADAQVDLVLMQDAGQEVPYLATTRQICVSQLWSTIAKLPTSTPPANTEAENVAYVIYTSGSTGTPKGVQVTHRGIGNLASAQMQAFGVNAQSHVLQFASLSFDASIFEIAMSLLVGGTLYLTTRDRLLPGPELLHLLDEWAITIVTMPPSALNALPTYSLPCLECLIVAGEACPTELVDRWAVKRHFYNAYGPTETTIWASVAECLPGQRPPIGTPITNTQLYVLDNALELVPIGVPGELYIGGIGQARGYLHRPDITAERFVPHPFASEPGARLYKTGDLVRYRTDGALEFLGRRDEQVKVRGYRIELGEIEAVIRQHQDVRECVVILREKTPGDQRLVAYVVANEPEADLSASTLRHYLQEKLPDYMVPSTFIVLPKLPLMPNGKIDRRALPSPEAHRVGTRPTPARLPAPATLPSLPPLSLPSLPPLSLPPLRSSSPSLPSLPPLAPLGDPFVHNAPRTPLEEAVAAIWCDVLDDDQVDIHENFFDLGGHSLLATQMVSRIRTVMGIELPLKSLFEAPTIAGISERIEQSLRGNQVVKTPIVSAPRTHPLPLSFAQQRLWFLDQLQSGTTAYSIPLAVRLQGKLHVRVLQRCLQEITQRHESLRTTFSATALQPIQIIHDAMPIPLAVIDLQSLAEPQQLALTLQFVAEETQHPFHLNTGPLVRGALLHLNEREHILLIVMHHIISDAWSLGVMVQELAALYAAFMQGKPSPLAPLPVHYADFALWQQNWLQGEVLKSLTRYWKKQLRGATPLALPTDRPHTQRTSTRGANYLFTLPAPLSQALVTLSNQEGVTLFMTLLAAFQILLYRYSNQTDSVIGTDIANRTHEESEKLIGFFVNLLVLRTDLSGKPSFRTLLQRVRGMVLDAYAHQDLPFEKIIDELQLERTTQQVPLIHALFVMQNTPMPPLELPGIVMLPLEVDPHSAKFDLAAFMSEGPEAIIGTLNYRTDVFDARTIETLATRFEALLHAIVAQPEATIDTLNIYTASELMQHKKQEARSNETYRRKLKIAKRSDVVEWIEPL